MTTARLANLENGCIDSPLYFSISSLVWGVFFRGAMKERAKARDCKVCDPCGICDDSALCLCEDDYEQIAPLFCKEIGKGIEPLKSVDKEVSDS
ncbi:hypothetical protein VCRLGP8_1430091 [Vibrio crassostreae]|nr:hypothetical protein EDB51_11794 [Vibrio crassostreae]CDT17436.1 hypothetical protein VCRLGP8_1430091 [Vibrio crassostreae]